jgi:hypothetical protein
MITQTACLAPRQIGQRPNSTIDDRDTGVVETPAGSILVTHFTSLAYEPILDRAERTPFGQPGGFAEQKLLGEWRAARDRLSPEQRRMVIAGRPSAIRPMSAPITAGLGASR